MSISFSEARRRGGVPARDWRSSVPVRMFVFAEVGLIAWVAGLNYQAGLPFLPPVLFWMLVSGSLSLALALFCWDAITLWAGARRRKDYPAARAASLRMDGLLIAAMFSTAATVGVGFLLLFAMDSPLLVAGGIGAAMAIGRQSITAT